MSVKERMQMQKGGAARVWLRYRIGGGSGVLLQAGEETGAGCCSAADGAVPDRIYRYAAAGIKDFSGQ